MRKIDRLEYSDTNEEGIKRLKIVTYRCMAFYPKHWLIEFTNKCDAGCVYCCKFGELYANDYGFMTQEIFDKFKRYLKVATSICIAGVGEPLLHSNFIQWIDEIRQISPKALLMIFTNGQIPFTTELLDCFKRNTVYTYISFDCWDKRIYESLRIKCSYDSTLENMKLLDRKLGIASIVVNKKTFPEIINTMKFVAPYVSSVYVNELFLYDTNKNFMSQRHILTEEQMFEILEMAKQLDLEVEGRTFFKDNIRDICIDPVVTACVSALGYVSQCLHCGKTMGCLQEDKFKDIWTNSRFKILIEDFCSSCEEKNTWVIL